jgi:hypothetical protein
MIRERWLAEQQPKESASPENPIASHEKPA